MKYIAVFGANEIDDLVKSASILVNRTSGLINDSY